MADERREEAREREPRTRGGRFADVRDQTGRLLFRISQAGIVQIKVKGQLVLVDIWEFLGEGE